MKNIKNKSRYVVNKDNYNCSTFLWNATLEVMIAMLAKELEEIRGLDKFKTTRQLNFMYLRKNKKAISDKNYGATKAQMSILKNEGY